MISSDPVGLSFNIFGLKLMEYISKYAKKAGRAAARPVVLLYYVMKSKETPKKDKAMIFATLAYLILPIDLIPVARFPIIGWADEVASLAVAYKKAAKYVTPEMQRKADELLDSWLA